MLNSKPVGTWLKKMLLRVLGFLVKLILPAIMEALDAPDTAVDADRNPTVTARLLERVREAKRNTSTTGRASTDS